MDDKPKIKNKEKDAIKTWTWRRSGIIAIIGVLYGLAMQTIFANMELSDNMNNLALVAFLGGVPLVIGGISTRMIPPVRRTWFNVGGIAIGMALVFILFAIMSNPATLICVAMASPFIVAIAVIGAMVFNWADRKMLEHRTSQYAFSGLVLILPLLLAPVEANLESPIWYRNVQDEIIIKASPEDVWDNIIRMETITPDQQRPSIYHMLGIPRPIKATLDHEGEGGVRIGYFEDGLTFVEEITHWDVNKQVRFAVDVRHNDASTAVLKHIGGRYFDVLEAGYEIVQLDDEHVVLRLDSDYRLSTNFNGYGAFWSDWILHDFQMYVLTTVKMRVES